MSSFRNLVKAPPLAPLCFGDRGLPPLSTGHVGMPTNIDERFVERNASIILPLFSPPPEMYVTAPLRRPCVVERTELSSAKTQAVVASEILNEGKRPTRNYTTKTLGAFLGSERERASEACGRG